MYGASPETAVAARHRKAPRQNPAGGLWVRFGASDRSRDPPGEEAPGRYYRAVRIAGDMRDEK